MRRMPAGVFKAHCLAVMKQVQATGEPVMVTKRAAPVVKLVPVETQKDDIFGCRILLDTHVLSGSRPSQIACRGMRLRLYGVPTDRAG